MPVGAEIAGSARAGAGAYFGGGGDPTDPVNGNVFGPGTVARKELFIFGAAFVWLLIVWRIVDGA